jgi:ribosomal protein S6--L-glutamate ligase
LLQSSKWLVQDGRLWITNKAGTHRPDGILWRLGAVKPEPMHRACLEMIRLTGIPCVNPPAALLRGYDRLAMLTELKLAGLPVIAFDVVAGTDSLEVQMPRLPAVLKLDNYHAGQAKALAHTESQWRDFVSLASPYLGYATVEPFISYQRDVRCLVVGDQFWTMERRSQGWKANVDTSEFHLITPEPKLVDWTRQAAKHFGADVLGLDFIQDAEGNYTLLESNDIPGVRGFPEEVRKTMALILMKRMG